MRNVTNQVKKCSSSRPEDLDKYSRLWFGLVIVMWWNYQRYSCSYNFIPWAKKVHSENMMFFIFPFTIHSCTGSFHLLDTCVVAEFSFLWLCHPSFLSLLLSQTHPQSFPHFSNSTLLPTFWFLPLYHGNCQLLTRARLLSICDHPIMKSLVMWSSGLVWADPIGTTAMSAHP